MGPDRPPGRGAPKAAARNSSSSGRGVAVRATPPGGGVAPLLAAVDRGAFPATLYLEGPSEPIKAAILWDLRHAWRQAHPEAPPARVLRVAESGVDAILSSYQGGSLFEPRELILVFEIEDVGRSEKRVAALAEGIARPGGESRLVLVESAAENPRKLLEPLRRACAMHVEADPPRRNELLGWGARRLKREQIATEPGVIEAVADACEGDALAFFSELARLTSFAGAGGTVTRQHAEDLLRPAVGAALGDYLAAVTAGDEPLALRRLGRLLAGGESEGSILWALTNLVGGALGGWAKQKTLSPALARRLGPGRLMRAMDAMYRAESAWKSGRADAIAVLEQATRVVASR